MYNTDFKEVSTHFSGHHQICIPEPMNETIQIIHKPWRQTLLYKPL